MPGDDIENSKDDEVFVAELADLVGASGAAEEGAGEPLDPVNPQAVTRREPCRVGVGWVENRDGSGSTLPGARDTSLNLVATLKAPCGWLRSDTTDTPISRSDFRRDDGVAPSASTVELLMLSGHGGGSSTGFILPKQQAILPGEVTFGGALLWVIFDSCEIFDDNGGNFPMSWADTFDTLHLMIASSNVVVSAPLRGHFFAERLNEGDSIIDAWESAMRQTSENVNAWWYMVPSRVEEAIRGETFREPKDIAPGDLDGPMVIRCFST